MTGPHAFTRPAARRGFTLVLAIMALGLAGITLAAIAGRVTLQERRTVSTAEDAQADQLLAAGVRIAETQAATTPADGPVPTPLGSVRLAWAGEPAKRSCAVDASFGRARRAVTVHFDGPRATHVSDE